MEQASRERAAIQAQEGLPGLLARRGPDARVPPPGIGLPKENLCLVRTLGHSSTTCLGPSNEVEITPERGRRSGRKRRVTGKGGEVRGEDRSAAARSCCTGHGLPAPGAALGGPPHRRLGSRLLKATQRSVCTSGRPGLQTPFLGTIPDFG